MKRTFEKICTMKDPCLTYSRQDQPLYSNGMVSSKRSSNLFKLIAEDA